MAQYNLLGGVNPINPEYDIQNSMRGKGTNWAEYGLRKEQLKEQKKQNRLNNVMQGINTAMNLVSAGLELKNNELKRESQELINTERALDIQSKRIDINNKQKEADEDAKFADGVMSLLEAKDYEKVGTYIYGTNPKILQRNEGITWSAIQSARDQFGDEAANKLLNYALPQRAQEMLKEQYANRRAELSYKSQMANAQSRIDSAKINAQARIDAAKIKQETDLFKSQNDMINSFLGDDINVGGSKSKPGVVNQAKADIANSLSNAIENLNPTLQSNDAMYNFFSGIGAKNEYGEVYSLIDQETNTLNLQAISDFYKNRNKFLLSNFKKYYDDIQKAVPPEILQQFIARGRLPLNPKVLKNMSGEEIKNILTNDSLVSTDFLPNSELFIPILQSYLQEENKPIGIKAKDSLFGSNENPNDSVSILIAFDSMGNALGATPVSQDDADNVRTIIKGAVAQNAYRQQAKKDALNMQKRLINFTNLTGISTQRQQAALAARSGELDSPRLNFNSKTRESEKQQLLDRVYSRYLEEGSEAALNEMMNLYGLNSINDLTAKKVNLLLRYTNNADKTYTDKDLSEMDEAEKTALYEELRAATSNTLADIAQTYYQKQTNKSNTNVLPKIDKSTFSQMADTIKTSVSDATTPVNYNKYNLEEESFWGKAKHKVKNIFNLGLLDENTKKEFEKYIGKDREKKLEKAFSKLSDRQEEEAKTKLNKVISTFNKEFNTKFNPIEFWWLFSDEGQLAYHINDIIRNIKDDPKKVQRFNELIDKYLLDKKPVINKKAIQTDVPSGNTNIG